MKPSNIKKELEARYKKSPYMLYALCMIALLYFGLHVIIYLS